MDGVSVDHSFATAWDAGTLLASRRSWWRIAKRMTDQSARPIQPTGHGQSRSRNVPVVVATRPGQVWSWDITDLRSPWRGKAFKAYSILDIFGRPLVGWRVEHREADHLAVEMFAQAIAEHGPPEVVHADSGAAMRSHLLRDFLASQGVELSFNRPSVSNDNPYSESEFRTMKYRPNYPGVFASLEEARAYLAWYVPWYNEEHKHSGIALFTPQQVTDGSWVRVWEQRDNVLQEYYRNNPGRYRRRPTTPRPAQVVGINHLREEELQAG